MNTERNTILSAEAPADWLRTFHGCEHYTDDEAIIITQTLDKLALILFDFTTAKDGIVIDNQLVISSNQEKELQTLAA